MSLLFVLWLSFINNGFLAQAANTTRNDSSTLLAKAADATVILEKLLDGYDKRLRPDFGGPPCNVNISIHVMSMVPIKEIDMEVTVVMFFRQYWIDPRLAFGPSLGIQKIKLSGNIVDQVWLPDIYFVNDLSDKSACGDFLFEVTQDGLITYSCRRKPSLYCPMNLQKFPMDEQICEMVFESYSYSTKDIILYWLDDNKGAVSVSKDLKIPQFTLVNWETIIRATEYSTGNFTTMATKFHLQRQVGYYILQDFIPTILIVAVSWVGFWIDERSVPARVSLGITTVLAITTLLFGVQSNLPRVGHVKAIDVYLLGSFLFVFAALVEFSIICSLTKVFSLNRGLSKQNRFPSSVSPSAIFDERNDVEAGCTCKQTGILPQAFENKDDDIQVKNHREENHNSSLSFATAFPKSSRSRLFRKSTRANSVKLPKHVSRPFRFQREPCTIDRHCRKVFPLTYALFLSVYFTVYFFAEV